MHVKECWACRGTVPVRMKSTSRANYSCLEDSRTVCNRVRPRCSKCAKSNRPCQYGLRLSWPKARNTKRSLTHSFQDVVGNAKGFARTSFVNATSWDIQLHDHLRMNQGFDSHKSFAFQRLDPPTALSWLPIHLGYEDRDHLDHFICIASSTLAIFEPDKNEFLGLLLRLALSDGSLSSMAVLLSALALSSFHRHGLRAEVFQFKARALRALIRSSDHCVESPTAVQHIAASMILCHLEMLGMPNEYSLWFCHLSEARRLIDNGCHNSQEFQGEFSRLLDWVEYHMVMSRFSHRHWYTSTGPVNEIRTSAPVKQGTCHSRKIKSLLYSSHEILRHFYSMFEMIRKPTDAMYHSDEYESTLRCLENKMTNIVPLAPEVISNDMSGLNTAWMATMEVFKLAALIYLKRASRNLSGSSPQIDAMVDRANILLHDLESFTAAFPLLIIGCEARTDEQRMSILERIERGLKTSSLRSLHGLQNILQQIWVQDDLAVNYELDYLNRLDAVISSYRIMPSFV